MPRMNGIAFLQTVRVDERLKTLLVFVLTTSESSVAIAASYQYNVAGYLVKRGVKEDFFRVLETLNNYWRILELP